MSESPYVRNVSAEDFAAVVLEASRSAPVLVDFWAAWCAPCRLLMPVLAKLVEEHQGRLTLAKVNTEEHPELAAQFAVRSLPTVMLFKGGRAVDQFLGALPEGEVRAFLDKHIPRESDALLAQADLALARGDGATALGLTAQAREADPGNPRAQTAYARVTAQLGRWDEAEGALASLPPGEQGSPEVERIRARVELGRITEGAPPARELESLLAGDPRNSRARHQLAALKALHGDPEGALEHLLALLQYDRGYGDDAARKGMLAVFSLLGGHGDLVARFRARMFNVLH